MTFKAFRIILVQELNNTFKFVLRGSQGILKRSNRFLEIVERNSADKHTGEFFVAYIVGGPYGYTL